MKLVRVTHGNCLNRLLIQLMTGFFLVNSWHGNAAEVAQIPANKDKPPVVDTLQNQVNPVPSAENTQVGSAEEKSVEATKPAGAIELPTVEVKAKKIRVITPLPGLAIDREQSTTNIQSASGKEIAETKAINVTEFMNSEMQSVSTNDYAGNPFQQDLNFRGFTASPSIGAAQGISVYLDGVRVNEAFGEVVNWDLIPMNAIASLDLIPGSNPMFGLNALGGALALRTKNGFTDNHARGQILAGSWGRKQVQLSNGFNNGTFGLFSALSYFDEDGWRKNSPSELWQIFNSATLRLPIGEINLSTLNVGTHLTGNGLLPYETAAINRTSVFTSPDESRNELGHYNLNARFDITDNFSFSPMLYKRNVKQSALSGDIYESYAALQSAWGGPDINGDGIDDVSLLNGMFNRSQLNQGAFGGALQFSLDLEKHQITAGLTLDKNNISFMQSQNLAIIDENHLVSLAADPVFADYGYGVETSIPGIIRNNLNGNSVTKSFSSATPGRRWKPCISLTAPGLTGPTSKIRCARIVAKTCITSPRATF